MPFPNVTLSFNIPTRTIAGTWDINASRCARGRPGSVSASQPVTVTMNGPNLQLDRHQRQQLLCPGNLGGAGGTICTTAAGVYSYTHERGRTSLGRTVRTQTLALTVT